MKLVVADSSPLIVLARSGLIPVLRQVAGEVLASATVFSECTADPERPSTRHRWSPRSGDQRWRVQTNRICTDFAARESRPATHELAKVGTRAQAITQAKAEGLIDVRPDVEAHWSDGPPPMLDAGELSVLALARDLGCPVLMDERLGRQVARLHGIPVIGSAGVLLAAKGRGFLPAVAPILTTWRGWSYFLAPELLKAVLTRAGEDG